MNENSAFPEDSAHDLSAAATASQNPNFPPEQLDASPVNHKLQSLIDAHHERDNKPPYGSVQDSRAEDSSSQAHQSQQQVHYDDDEQDFQSQKPYHDVQSNTCPPYNDNHLAVREFAHPFFYQDLAHANKHKERRLEYLQRTKVHEIRARYPTPSKRTDFFHQFFAYAKPVEEYFSKQETPTEDVLNTQKLVFIQTEPELDKFDERFVKLPVYDSLLHESDTQLMMDDAENTISTPRDIVYVMGPSGSGKTFFAVGVAATRDDNNLDTRIIACRHVTLYLNLSTCGSQTEGPNLLGLIHKQICLLVPGYDSSKPLNMHVSLVLDEAGSSNVEKFFEDKNQVIQLCDYMKQHLAISFRLVVSGTGVFGTSLCSVSDCRKIRMKQWTQDEFIRIATKEDWTDEAIFTTLIASIYLHPILSALTTNARAANYLLGAVILRLQSANTERENWQNFLWEDTAELVGFVVQRYINRNGLKGLKVPQRRRVAAWVFYIVEESRRHGRSKDPLNVQKIVEGDLVNKQDMPVVWGLMDVNDIYTSTENCKFARGDGNSVLLSPALAIVLFSLLGGTASVVTSWAGQEYVTALLYADVVARFVLYQSKHTETDATVIYLLLELAKCGLLKSEFVKLFDDKVEERARRGLIVTNALYATWMSGPAKSTHKDQSTLKRDRECKPKPQFNLKTQSKRRPTSESKVPSKILAIGTEKQDSRAYPEAMLHMPSTEAPISYSKVTSAPAPAKDCVWQPKITFVVSFNLRDTVLKLDLHTKVKGGKAGWALSGPGKKQKWENVNLPADIALSSSNLDENGFFKPPKEAMVSWRYIRNAVRDDVDIKFLWTG
jgi:hypothetical protein